ncbi:MAG TPA: von Willebrand factor type A domain-containing protein, partial [Opitutaceae bacterium]|nr:von Willebrand factor type A domain-containing protein [Opitutaceae bacterium]
MNEMKLLPDDPRLTAYALGELEGEERTAVDAAVQADPAARAAVEEIRATARQLEAALAAEAEKETKEIPAAPAVRHLEPYVPARKLVRFPYWLVAGLAAAGFAALLAIYPPVEHVAQQKAATNAPAAGQVPPGYVEVPLEPLDNSSQLAKPSETDAKKTALADLGRAASTAQTTEDRLAGAAVPRPVVGQTEASSLQKESGLMPAAVPSEQNAVSGKTGGGELPAFSVSPARQAGERTANFKALGRVNAAAFNTEAYAYHADNDFLSAAENPLSTFALDVDTASYANVRRFLAAGQRPPADAVRIEELVNYFPFEYAPPRADTPLAVTLEAAAAPWAPSHRLVRIGLKARDVAAAARPAENLVFLIDVSGSMDEPNKLPLVKQSLRMLLDQLRPDDRVAIVTYAGESGLALPSTPASHQREILEALDALQADGSTNGARGLELAYDIAKANFISSGTNRVILATDGDFNVGLTNE